MLLPEPPRVGEPESALIPGMSAPKAEISPLTAFQSFGGVGGLADTSTASPTPPGELLQSPIVWTYDLNPTSGNWRATFNGEVNITQGGAVTSFNGRTGAVTLTAADLTGAGGLTANNAALTGTPTAPTASPASTATTQIATTAFVQQAIAATPTVNSFNGRLGAVTLSASDITSAGGALTASPSFTGTPQAPTAALGDASSLIATTQFVANAIGGGAVTAFNGRKGAVTLQLTDVTTAGGAPLASPGFTGTPNAPTAAPGTATTQLATTAFVTNAITGATTGVSSFNTRTGAVTLTTADITGAGGAPNTSPNLAGTPQAPTATAGTATAQIATTQFVATAISNLPAGVSTFNGRSGTVTLQLADVTSVGGAPLASPTFTGTARAPTPTAGDNSTDIATTAFVGTALGSYLPLAGGVITGAVTHNAALTVSNGNLGTFGGGLEITGAPATGPAANWGLSIDPATTAGAYIRLNAAAAAQGNGIGAFVAGSQRWQLYLGDNTAETGSDAGSLCKLNAYSDAGVFKYSALSFTRTGGLTVTGTTTLAGSLLINNQQITQTASQPTFALSKTVTSGGNCWIMGETNGLNRWLLYLGDSTAEGGSNTGSNASLVACSDAGSYNIIAWGVQRNTGVVTFSQPIVNGSDIRRKSDIAPIKDALERIRQLAGVSYERETNPGRRELGLIAQDVQEIVPEAVQECCPEPEEAPNKIATREAPELGICYTQFTALLIEAVKELATRLDALEGNATA